MRYAISTYRYEYAVDADAGWYKPAHDEPREYRERYIRAKCERIYTERPPGRVPYLSVTRRGSILCDRSETPMTHGGEVME